MTVLPICERLRHQYPIAIADPDFVEMAGMPTVLTLANPDGPEAADLIDELVKALERAVVMHEICFGIARDPEHWSCKAAPVLAKVRGKE